MDAITLMEDTGSILSSLFKNLGMEDRFVLARLQRKWTVLFNEPLSLHTYPASLNNGVLAVNVDSPVWLQQLKFFKQPMLEKLGAYRVTAIDFRHGRIHSPGRARSGKHSGNKALTGTDNEWIEQTVSTLDDPELQDRIRKVLEKALRVRG